MLSIFAFLVQCYSLSLLIKTDSTVICVPCMLEPVMSHFLQNIADLEDISC